MKARNKKMIDKLQSEVKKADLREGRESEGGNVQSR